MDLREAHVNTSTRHPWEVARARFFGRQLRDSGALAQLRSGLDIGAGDAWFAAQLAPQLPATARLHCVDAAYTQASMAALQTRLPPQIALYPAPPAGRHDLVLLLDVLEHVQDDRTFLREIAQQRMEAGGRILISVPAWQGLFTSHDTFLHHFRRYSPQQARAVIEGAGLRIEASGGLFHSLLLPRLAARVVEQVAGPRPQSQDPGIAWNAGPLATAVVGAALSLDNVASTFLAQRGVDVPGLTWWALCRT